MLDWLSVTGQSVLEVTAGPVFTDRTRDLAGPVAACLVPTGRRALRAGRGMAAALPAMPMVGRTAEAADAIGSRLVSAGLTGDLISLAFTLSRRWAPYAKWRGTVSARSPSPPCSGRCSVPPRSPDGGTARTRWRPLRCSWTSSATGVSGARGAVIPFFDRPYRTVDGTVTQVPWPASPTGNRAAAAHGGVDRAVG